MSDPSPFEPLPPSSERPPVKSSAKSDWETIWPVPADAPKPPDQHYNNGKPAAVWTYRSPLGAIVGFIWRFDLADGSKEIIPLTYCRDKRSGRQAWRFRSWDEPRPLYGLDDLHARPGAPVLVAEGEKAADAAGLLLPDHVVVTSPGGSKAAAKADWKPLRGRAVTIWPDADEAGWGYARIVARQLAQLTVKPLIAVPPQGMPSGWDVADALAGGWGSDRTKAHLGGAVVAEEALAQAPVGAPSVGTRLGTNREGRQSGRRRRGDDNGEAAAQRDQLVKFERDLELWRDHRGAVYASIPLKGHIENWPVRSKQVEFWLTDRFYGETGSIPNSQALAESLRWFEGIGRNKGIEHQTYRRVGEADGRTYVDLADEAWRAVEVDAKGWRVVDHPPVKFIRSNGMRPLPVPERGGMIEHLRSYVNVAGDEDFALMVAWLVSCLRPRPPYPILGLSGEEGSAKSSTAKVLRQLVDPSVIDGNSAPRDIRDLFVIATNNHVLSFDNLSGVEAWLSDALCRISTGGGISTRELTTDANEVILQAACPIILNGIGEVATRSDLLSRMVSVVCPVIPPEDRRLDDDLRAAFKEDYPRLFGAVLDAVSAGIRELPNVKLTTLPRMADFVRWGEACAPGLGWEPGYFQSVYDANRQSASRNLVEGDLVARALQDALKLGDLEMKPHELLVELEKHISESTRRSTLWPKSAQTLGTRLRRLAPGLRTIGIECVFGKAGADSHRVHRVTLKDRAPTSY